MAKKIYIRTPESSVTVQDDDIKAANILELPTITADNEDDQRPGCVGIKEGVPVYHNGTELTPFAAGTKPAIATTADFVINWQTDNVPGTNKTYAKTFGNHIFDVKGVWDNAGVMSPYTPDWSYTKSGNLINKVTLNQVYAGELTFI